MKLMGRVGEINVHKLESSIAEVQALSVFASI
jgi:hypothetical protein